MGAGIWLGAAIGVGRVAGIRAGSAAGGAAGSIGIGGVRIAAGWFGIGEAIAMGWLDSADIGPEAIAAGVIIGPASV